METYENLSRYKIFLSVAECKSISKAAAQLYISQPAVSITIKKLEDYLHTTLFIRKSKGVELTENGRKLYENAKRALNRLIDTEDRLRFHQNTGAGSLIEIELSKPISPCEIGFLYNRIQPMNENILKFIKIQSD